MKKAISLDETGDPLATNKVSSEYKHVARAFATGVK